MLPASPALFVYLADTDAAAEGFLSDILGIGASETADTWTSSKNFLNSLSVIVFLADDFCSALAYDFEIDFFSGVAGTATGVFFGVGGFLGVGGFVGVLFPSTGSFLTTDYLADDAPTTSFLPPAVDLFADLRALAFLVVFPDFPPVAFAEAALLDLIDLTDRALTAVAAVILFACAPLGFFF